jgi:lysophospholipase L1-like esterase
MLIAAVALCLGGAEALLRFKNSSMRNYDIEMWRYGTTLKIPSANPLLGHEHLRNASEVLQSVEIRTNEYGLRGGPLPARSSTQRRILFLGSSVTLGWGVPEEETVTARLEKKLRDGGEDVIVLNGGIGNYNAVRYVERFMTQLTDIEPTDIVVHAFVRDAEVLETGRGNWLLRNSQLAVVLYAALQRQSAGTGITRLEDHYRKIYDPQSPGLLAAKEALERLSKYSHEHHIRLYMAMTPDIHNLQNYPLGFIHDAMKEIAQQNGYAYLDLHPAFKDIRAEDVWAMPGDPHPNSLGHERMADAIYPMLKLQHVAAAR